MSDGAGVKCYTFCTILDRNDFLTFLNYWVWRKFRESGMLDLGRFPVSDEFLSDRKTFCTILDRKDFFGFFELLVLDKRSRDHRAHGNVGNRLADRMEALSDSCGAVFRSKWPSEEQKSRF